MNTTKSGNTPAPQTSLSDVDLIGPYRIEAILGEGAMGKVYLATHTQLKRKVAIKTMRQMNESDPHRIGRFQREMEAVGRLDHPNIVRATDAGQDQGIQFIAMEFVEGTDVQNILDQCGPLSPALACEIVRQTAEGLSNIQEHGLVHRDLKPSNLIVSRAGQVKILDLGIARLRDDDKLGTLTADGGLMGTPDFIAPEQVLETGCVDIRADIYSLGCTLYRMLSGRLPFEGPDYGTNVAKVIGHTQKDPEDLVNFAPDTPPEILNLVKRMMEKSPDDRIQTPQEVAEAVAEWADGAELPRIVAKNINKTTVVIKKPNGPASKQPASSTASSETKVSWKWLVAGAAVILGALALGFPASLSDSNEPVTTVSVASTHAATPTTTTRPAEGQTINVATVQPAIEQVAVATTELNNTAKNLAGSVQNIDTNTQQIAETLEQLRDSFASASHGGQIISNPQTVGEIYANAQTYAKQGKHALARESYTTLMSKDVPFVDVHKNFQRLLIVQEGASRARDFYENVGNPDTPTIEFAKTLLLDKEQRRDALVKFVASHSDFGPAVYELSHCVTNDDTGNKTLTEKKWEKKLLRHFLTLHDDGQVLRFYLDQSEAAQVVEEATRRLEKLEARTTSFNRPQVTMNMKRHGNLQVFVQTPEHSRAIHYSTDGDNYRETGKSGVINPEFGEPLAKPVLTLTKREAKAKNLFVKYTDLRNTEHGPFEFEMSWQQEKTDTIRDLLFKHRGDWVRFHASNGRERLLFVSLIPFQEVIEQVRYGVNVREPNRTHALSDAANAYVDVREDAKFVVVRLKFKDGTQSEIERFDR